MDGMATAVVRVYDIQVPVQRVDEKQRSGRSPQFPLVLPLLSLSHPLLPSPLLHPHALRVHLLPLEGVRAPTGPPPLSPLATQLPLLTAQRERDRALQPPGGPAFEGHTSAPLRAPLGGSEGGERTDVGVDVGGGWEGGDATVVHGAHEPDGAATVTQPLHPVGEHRLEVCE